jgi:hypothetical protein
MQRSAAENVELHVRDAKEHITGLYVTRETDTTSTKEAAPKTVGKINVASADFTYLQTVRIWIIGPTNHRMFTRCVPDGGSQSSFVAKSLVDCRDLLESAFESRPSELGPRRVARFCAKSSRNNTIVPITAFGSALAFCPYPTARHITTVAQIRKM